MNVKKTFTLILLFLILFSTLNCASADDDKSYKITHAFVDLDVESDGLLHISERYDYSFKGKFNGVYRDIPLKDGESIDNIKVSAVGAYPVLKESNEDGYKHLKIYLYSDASHTKGIRDCDVSVYIKYDMKNVITLFNDIGALQFKIWGEEWDVGVGSVKFNVNLLGTNSNEYFLNPQEYNQTSEINGNTISGESTSISKGDFYELLVLMPLSDFDNAVYAKQVNQNGKDMIVKNLKDSVNGRNFWSMAFIILGLLSLLSPIGALITYLRYGREPKVDYDGIYERELPTNDSPEIVNALVHNKKGIGRPDMKGFEASIMNLIDKKVLKIKNREDEKTNTNELLITFNNDNLNSLSSSERIVFDTLKHFSNDNTLNLSRLNKQLSFESEAKWFMNQIVLWADEVENNINTQEYFNNKGSKIIKSIILSGIIFGIILAIAGFVTNIKTGYYGLFGGIGLIIFSVVLAHLDDDIFGQWTSEGRVFYLKWMNFKKFLKDNSLINQHPPESIVIWKQYLIYGASLGVADKVYDAMKLKIPNISNYDDDLFMYHYYGGYHMMYSAYRTGQSAANPSSDSSSFGSVGGGSGGGGGGAF